MRTLRYGEISLTESESIFLQDNVDSESSASVTPIWVGNILNYCDGQTVTFTVPNSNNLVLTAEAAYVQSQSSSNFNWAGTINGSGYFMLNNSGGRMSGLIQTNNQSWTILPFRDNYSLLIKHDMASVLIDDCITPPDGGGGTSTGTENCNEEYNTCPAIIDVLLFATSAAQKFTGSGNFDAWSQWGENVTNFAFERSDVPNKRVRFRWVEYDPNWLTPTDQNPIHILDGFKNDNFVNQTLDTYKADLAVLVTNHGLFRPDGSKINGIANIGTWPLNYPSSSSRHCVVEIPSFFSPSWTLPHELSHLMGANHNRSWNVPCFGCGSDQLDCAHGWKFFTSGDEEWRTMHALVNNVNPTSMRILNYSNPDVDFLGTPTGHWENNNAKVLRNTGCMIAGYAISKDFGIDMLGATKFCNPGQVPHPNYSVTITPPSPGFPGFGPYTIEWWQNSSGIFTYQAPDYYLGSSSQVQVSIPPDCPFFFLHVKVTSADGIILTNTRKIDTDACAGCGGEARSSLTYPDLVVNISSNPTSGFFNLDISVEKQGRLNISLYDSGGKMVRDLGNENFEPGPNRIERNVEGNPSGFYWLSLVSDSQKISLPLIILK